MTIQESCAEVGYLKGLFPGLSKEQEDFWCDVFIRFKQCAVRASIKILAENCGDFVNRPMLLDLIESRSYPLSDRRKREAAESLKRREIEEKERQRAAVEQARIDLALAPYSAEIEELKTVALLNLPADTAQFFARHDPRKNPVVKMLLVQHLKLDLTAPPN